MERIGSTNVTALLCHTNCPPPPGDMNSRGDWFTPHGTRVPNSGVAGFLRNRGSMSVRLKRNYDDDRHAVQGLYTCKIMDKISTLHIVYVGLYNDRAGVFSIIATYILLTINLLIQELSFSPVV